MAWRHLHDPWAGPSWRRSSPKDTYGPEAWKSAKVIFFLGVFWLGGLGV